ncbi:hypothetical protein CesoFtcFv8_017559 [Champsocephalus esox]|nr:hypothetical protein CesoFtcFv8_017559 [Champsocephalus esox]
MAGSGTDAWTVSSGSSAWEGQLTSLVLSEYASTEMSIHALYMHEFHKQQSRGELSRHTWHRQESDESSDSIPDEVRSEPNPHSRHLLRSHTFPTTVPSPCAIPTSASAIVSTARGQEGAASSHKSSSQRPFSGSTADSFSAGGRVLRSARGVPMGGWAEEGQAAPRHPDPLPEEGLEDDMPPHIHKVT